ncbi:MAG: hypothetical protein KIT09_21760 [Bryobacteraceae bacterium]|nr:hypothetical protein [Bryobacteraceae bacterium]
MSELGWILLVAVIVIGAAALAFYKFKIEPSKRLKQQFGPEYDKAVREYGSEARAEAELARREQRVSKLHIRSLTPSQRETFRRDWLEGQARFVDDPGLAVAEADRLIAEVMEERGYPVHDFEQQAADISVHYPTVVENYRAAHRIELRRRENTADTEDLRQALVHYRELFEELLGEPERVSYTEDDVAARRSGMTTRTLREEERPVIRRR